MIADASCKYALLGKMPPKVVRPKWHRSTIGSQVAPRSLFCVYAQRVDGKNEEELLAIDSMAF